MDAGELDIQEIFDTYQPRILRYLTHLVGEAEAEDLAQEVFVKVSQALPGFRGEAQLSTWIYRIATNTAVDKLRTAAFRHEAEQSDLDDLDEIGDPAAWVGEEIPSLEQHLMRQEMYECFMRYVAELPVGYRTVVVLGELEELTNAEIAAILGLSLDVVKIRLHRARARLFRELKAHCQAEDWL